MKRFLMSVLLCGCFGMAHADDSSTSIAQTQAKETLAEPCWNLKVGDLYPGQYFLLSLIAQENPESTSQVKAIVKAKKISQQDREQLCKSIEESKI